VRAEDGITPVLLFTENETNTERLFGVANSGRYVKDGIDDAIVHGLRDRVNEERGTKVAAHVHALVDPGESFTIQIRLTPGAKARPFVQFDAVMSRRLAEADEFYAGVICDFANTGSNIDFRKPTSGVPRCCHSR
jgi:hypothetical protein